MKKVVKITALAISLVLIFALVACGGNEEEENISNEKVSLFGKTDLSEYVVLGEYKNIVIDDSSDDYYSAQQTEISKDIKKSGASGGCYSDPSYSGKVRNGDIANIDYVGKKDGVAFQGGTAQGYDLTIGSGTFIDGFESGLIGVNIGDTVDLNLRFPDGYGNAELAGAAVVFTVKVNYVKTPEIGKIYDKVGFTSFEEYMEDLSKRAAKTAALNQVIGNSRVSGVPKKDIDILFNAQCEDLEARMKASNTTFVDVLKSRNMTLADYKAQITESLQKELREYMVYYYILEKENLEPEYDLPDNEKTGQAVLDEKEKVKHVVSDFVEQNTKVVTRLD